LDGDRRGEETQIRGIQGKAVRGLPLTGQGRPGWSTSAARPGEGESVCRV
jgi:hypothetical protein